MPQNPADRPGGHIPILLLQENERTKIARVYVPMAVAEIFISWDSIIEWRPAVYSVLLRTRG